MLINPNPMWLTDVVTIAKEVDDNRYQKKTYADPKTFRSVRFDHTVKYSGIGNDRVIARAGTVYLYAFNQTMLPADKSWLHAKLKDTAGDEYIIQTVSPHQQDTSSAWYCVELGVL
jgi:hypothetical protein